MTLTPELLKQMKDAAGRATPGPWYYDCGNGEVETVPHRIGICERSGNYDRELGVKYTYGEDIPEDVLSLLKHDNEEDLEFIALCSPENILALIEEIESLRPKNGCGK